MATPYDVIIKNGLVFDGSERAATRKHIAIKDGVVAALSDLPLNEDGCDKVIDAEGRWVTPGFLDTHTHYDAEVIAAPALRESVRHGVTTVTIGSCSISMVLSDAIDCADLFTRVEAVPRQHVLPILQERKQWFTPGDYVKFYENHPLGPNVTSFIGHSDIRAKVMGLKRAVDPDEAPTQRELKQMEQWLSDAMDNGLLGLSSMTTKWDKLDGDRFRSASLPSTYAKWREFRRLNKVLRARGRVHQGAPNIVTKWNMFLFLWESVGLMRRPLKTTLITLMDPKADPWLWKPVTLLTRFVNKVLKADFRWQALPNKFEVYADGMDLVIFEEFGSGQAALHLQDELARNELLKEESYRRWFRKDYEKKWGPRVWHRDLYDADIIDCPDKSLIGKTFGEIADERGLHVADLFLDVIVEHGPKLRWHTVMANHRKNVLERIVQEDTAVISFADSGAHIRNMAFYNFPLRLLKLVKESADRGQPIMGLERAVHRVSGELADWFGIDAGYIAEGKRADLVVINPEGLAQDLETYHEDDMERFDGVRRMVNRNEGVVEQVLINGKLAYDAGRFDDKLGSEKGFGTFLRAS